MGGWRKRKVWQAAGEPFEGLRLGPGRDWPGWWELFGLQEVEGLKKEVEEGNEKGSGRARKEKEELKELLPLDLVQGQASSLGLFL